VDRIECFAATVGDILRDAHRYESALDDPVFQNQLTEIGIEDQRGLDEAQQDY